MTGHLYIVSLKGDDEGHPVVLQGLPSVAEALKVYLTHENVIEADVIIESINYVGPCFVQPKVTPPTFGSLVEAVQTAQDVVERNTERKPNGRSKAKTR